MTKLRRGVGKGNPRGETKRKILLMLMEKYPDRIEELEILNKLWAKDHIGENAGIRRHLQELVKKGIEYNKDERWAKLREDDAEFPELALEFLASEHAKEFLDSHYAQKMINPELLLEIKRRWVLPPKTFPSVAVVKKERAGYNEWEEAQKLPATEKEIDVGGKKVRISVRGGGIPMEPYWQYGTPGFGGRFFTEEDVRQILKLSPTALQKSLEGPGNLKDESTFCEMLLSSLILDFNTYYYPQGYTMKPSIKVELHREGEREPFLNKEAGIPVIHQPPPREVNESSQPSKHHEK